ncbi:sodium/solute symporter [bacterium]|nr:sodium/solute symporter [bacterium]
MNCVRSIIIFLLVCLTPVWGAEKGRTTEVFRWERLPDLPDSLGVAGSFAGVSNDVLIVAGGAHFPVSLFNGGKKVWVDSGYVLSRDVHGLYAWKESFTLNRPLAYGASVSTGDGIIFIGGCDAERCYDDVFRVVWDGEGVRQIPMARLPKPCAFMSAALLGHTVYVAGGQNSLDPPIAADNFWALDLLDESSEWKELKSWPGPPRILAVAAAQGNALYLMSGHDVVPGSDGSFERVFLTDAYRYDPVQGLWSRAADLPRSAAAAPGPGLPLGQSHIVVFGGNDGEYAGREMELRDNHPGFSRDILAYHTITDTWVTIGEMPVGLVTTNAVQWNNGVVITSGEIRPGVRSPLMYHGIQVPIKVGFSHTDYGVLIIYLLVLIAMGFYFSREERTTEDFFLAGRTIPWWAAGLSIFGTQLSAITFMSIPAKSYSTDWTFFLYNMGIIAVAPLIVFCFLPFYRRLNITTAYEYLEMRFNPAVRLAGSASFIVFQLGRMGVVLYLPAIALSAVTGINIYLCITVMGVLCTTYTVLGGMKAVIWTDVVQVIILLSGVILSIVLIAMKVDGGMGGILHTGVEYGKFRMADWHFAFNAPTVWVILIAWFGNLIAYTSDQAVIQRYLTTKSEKQAARSIWTNAVLTVPASVLFFGVGTALFVFYRYHPGMLNPELQTDAIFPWFIAHELPSGISGLVVAGIFAAAMSSLDSSLNSTATAVVTDFYRRFSDTVTDRFCLNLARLLTVLLGGIATATALIMVQFNISSLWDMFLKIIGLFGGSLAGLFMLGIFTKRAQGQGALAGFIISIIIQYLIQSFQAVHFLLFGVTGIISCFIAGYLASLFFPAPESSNKNLTLYTLTD